MLVKALSFKNSVAGATALINKINLESLHIGVEATVHYWLSLYSFLIENQYTVRVINPIQIDGWRKATEICKRKRDIIDSLLIAVFENISSSILEKILSEISLKNLLSEKLQKFKLLPKILLVLLFILTA